MAGFDIVFAKYDLWLFTLAKCLWQDENANLSDANLDGFMTAHKIVCSVDDDLERSVHLCDDIALHLSIYKLSSGVYLKEVGGLVGRVTVPKVEGQRDLKECALAYPSHPPHSDGLMHIDMSPKIGPPTCLTWAVSECLIKQIIACCFLEGAVTSSWSPSSAR